MMSQLFCYIVHVHGTAGDDTQHRADPAYTMMTCQVFVENKFGRVRFLEKKKYVDIANTDRTKKTVYIYDLRIIIVLIKV